MARKRPITTEELLDIICKILKEKGRLPDILDYGLATHNPVPITTSGRPRSKGYHFQHYKKL